MSSRSKEARSKQNNKQEVIVIFFSFNSFMEMVPGSHVLIMNHELLFSEPLEQWRKEEASPQHMGHGGTGATSLIGS